MSETNSRYGIPADTNIGMPPVRPPASAESPRSRMIRNAKRYAEFARRAGFRYVAQICDIAADAIVALNTAERQLAVAHRRIDELERQQSIESFATMEETIRRVDSTQEIKRQHLEGGS